MPDETGKENKTVYKIRPGALDFLLELKEFYEIILYSSRKLSVIQDVAHLLDPKNTIFSQILSRKSCYLTKSKKFIKDLRIFKNRNIKDMIIVDYKPQSFATTPKNGVILIHWNGDEADTQLIDKKFDYLAKLSKEYSCEFKNSKIMNYQSLLEIALRKPETDLKASNLGLKSKEQGISTATTDDLSRSEMQRRGARSRGRRRSKAKRSINQVLRESMDRNMLLKLKERAEGMSKQ
jgi:hypothetical protein